MAQPALSDSLLCMHLGGAKEVRRWHAGRSDVHDVALGALTIMPANFSNRWLTRGPIDFTHLMIGPALINQVALEEFDRDSAGFHLSDAVGFRDPYLESLFLALVEAAEGRGHSGRLYRDSLLVVLIVALLDRRSTLMKTVVPAVGLPQTMKGGLAPWKLRRVVDYMMENRCTDICLAELTALAGLSRAQFFRSFKQSTGMTPHRYLTELRLDAAKVLLDQQSLDLSDIASAAGLPSAPRFGALFFRRFGVTPRAYRKSTR